MILRIIILSLLSFPLVFAVPNPLVAKICDSDKKNCQNHEKHPVLTPIQKEISPQNIGENTANLTRLDNEGFTIRLDCSKFGAERVKDFKEFLLDLKTPEECQKNSPFYNERVLILISPVVIKSSTPLSSENLPKTKP